MPGLEAVQRGEWKLSGAAGGGPAAPRDEPEEENTTARMARETTRLSLPWLLHGGVGAPASCSLRLLGTGAPGAERLPWPWRRSLEHITVSSLVRPTSLVARFDFLWDDAAYHQETPENVKLAIKATKKICNVMLELQEANMRMSILFSLLTREASSKLLPINFSGLAKAIEARAHPCCGGSHRSEGR